jgi:predicted RNA-binding Zn ribbon-like protein
MTNKTDCRFRGPVDKQNVVAGPAYPPGEILRVLDEIRDERDYQDTRWGTEFDDKNDLDNWVRYIITYAARASNFQAPPSQQRRDLVKVAAIAVAAVQAFDRNGGFPPRHYEDIVAKDDSDA